MLNAASLPKGPQRAGSQAGKGQKRDKVGTFKAAAMCMGPVLADTSRSRARRGIIPSRRSVPMQGYRTPGRFYRGAGMM